MSGVVVVGAGQMGGGIAQVAAAAGLEVLLLDVAQDQLVRARSSIRKSASKLAEKGGPRPDEVLARIRSGTTLPDRIDADVAIEAVVESEDVKRTVLRELDERLPNRAILATNTSSIPITRLASATKRADRFIGMHFMNPVPVLSLVEIIPGLDA